MEKYKTYKELDGSSIERWAIDLDAKPKQALSEEDAELLIRCKANEEELEKDSKGSFEELLNGWNGVAVLHKRLALHSFTMSKAAKLFCGTLIDRPGMAVIMLNYFQYKCHSLKIKHIDMDTLCTRIIPNGWFTPYELHIAWESQKYISSDGSLLNMLDNLSFRTSISDVL